MDRPCSEFQSLLSDQDPTEVRLEVNHDEIVGTSQVSKDLPQQQININKQQDQQHQKTKSDPSKSLDRINICFALYEAQFLSETMVTFELLELFKLHKIGEIKDIALKKNSKEVRLYLNAMTQFKYNKEKLEFLVSKRLGRAKMLKVTANEINTGFQLYSLDLSQAKNPEDQTQSQNKQGKFQEQDVQRHPKIKHEFNEGQQRSKLEEPQLEKKVCQSQDIQEISTAQSISCLNSELMRYVLQKLQVQESILTQLHLFLNFGQNLVYGIINFFVSFWCRVSQRNFTLISQESLSYQKHFDNTIKNQTLILPILQNQVWEFYIFYQESYSLLWGGVRQNQNIYKQVLNYFEQKNQPLEVSTSISYPPLLRAFESGVYLLIYLYNIIVNGIRSQLAIDQSYIPQFLNFLQQQSIVAQMDQERQNV